MLPHRALHVPSSQATAMSKIRRSTAMIPTAEAYVKRSLATIGRSFDSVPYPTHNWLAWFMRKTMNEEALTRKTCGRPCFIDAL